MGLPPDVELLRDDTPAGVCATAAEGASRTWKRGHHRAPLGSLPLCTTRHLARCPARSGMGQAACLAEIGVACHRGPDLHSRLVRLEADDRGIPGPLKRRDEGTADQALVIVGVHPRAGDLSNWDRSIDGRQCSWIVVAGDEGAAACRRDHPANLGVDRILMRRRSTVQQFASIPLQCTRLPAVRRPPVARRCVGVPQQFDPHRSYRRGRFVTGARLRRITIHHDRGANRRKPVRFGRGRGDRETRVRRIQPPWRMTWRHSWILNEQTPRPPSV